MSNHQKQKITILWALSLFVLFTFSTIPTYYALAAVLIPSSNSPVPLNLKREVYAFGMFASGDEAAWDTVWDRYTRATSGQEEDNLLYSLTRTTDTTLIDRWPGLQSRS